MPTTMSTNGSNWRNLRPRLQFTANSATMQNPFKKADAVLTRFKSVVVEATVTQTWNNEVQVKTTTGDVLWRTMYTVWHAGSEPLKRQPKAEPAAATAEHAESASSQCTKRQPRQTTLTASKSKPRRRK